MMSEKALFQVLNSAPHGNLMPSTALPSPVVENG